jgi:DNA invertase Pin-like site-specific DNA recombinase
MKVVAYYRVSTDKQAASGLGLDAQRSSVEAFCAAKGWEIVASCTDEGISGTSNVIDRPGLVDALTALHKNEGEALVSAKIDRLSRDVVVQRTIEKALAQLGARFVSAAGEGTEDDSPGSKLVKTILSAVAENEAAIIGIRTKAALQAAKEKGRAIGRPPLGCEIDGDGKIVPGAEHYLVRCILWLRYERFLSYQRIANEMNDSTVVERTKRTFTRTTVGNVVKRWGQRKEWFRGVKSLDDLLPTP